MSKYYNAKRVRNLYEPLRHGSGQADNQSYRLSRSKLDSFLQCPRCFYLDRRLGVGQPPGFPFALNSAVDRLLKREFDTHRAAGIPHPLMEAHGVDAIPFAHPQLDTWRDALGGGIQFHHRPTNFLITGGIDDVWVNPRGDLHIVDYKATAKEGAVTLDSAWQDGYKRQMEIYQWLFRQNGFPVDRVGYFVYANGDASKEAFDGQLEFDLTVIPYEGDDGWVERAIYAAHKCLTGNTPPVASPDCDFCAYREAARAATNPTGSTGTEGKLF